MNDPIFLEAAKVMGEEITRSGSSLAAVAAVFRKLTGRSPHADEQALLIQQQRIELAKFNANESKQKGLLAAGNYRVPRDLNAAELAANTVVSSTIINMDATLIKR
jgi:AraC-like DNA-binding protein